MKNFIMKKLIFSFATTCLLIMTLHNLSSAQVVNRKGIEGFLQEGEVGKAQKSLESYLGSKELTFEDSIYILKNLGVLYSSSNKRKELGDKYFYRLLDLDPFSSIHDTYASNTILARFKKIRKTYQTQKGGKALVPAVAVFDFRGKGIDTTSGVAMTQQFIAEMQRMDVFHTLDRSVVIETMDKMRMQPEKCIDVACRLDIARRLTADKLITVETNQLDTVYTFTLNYIDVESGSVSTKLTKVYAKNPQKLMAEGFGELAVDLENHEAAWLNLSVTPTNTILTIDGSPMATISSRVPLNPGKHKICGNSPGYESLCKDFEVKASDALTYAFVLKTFGGTAVQAPKRVIEEDVDEDGGPTSGNLETPDKGDGNSGSSAEHHFIWWTLGGMAILAVTLAVLFNTKN